MRIAAVHPSSQVGLPEVELQARAQRRRSYASPGVEIVDYYIEGENIFDRPFAGGHVGAVVAATVQRIQDAAASDPDVIMVLGGIEPGVREAREIIKHIPIIGTGLPTYQVAAQIGAQVGYRLGIIVYEASIIEPMRAQGRLHKADWMITDMRSIDVPLPELYGRREEVRTRIVATARAMVADGCTMIFPQGLSMVPASMSSEELSEAIGVPVLNGEQIVVRAAEMIGGLNLLKGARAQGASL
jgi:Asp/Glu/hydantoin racemase